MTGHPHPRSSGVAQPAGIGFPELIAIRVELSKITTSTPTLASILETLDKHILTVIQSFHFTVNKQDTQ